MAAADGLEELGGYVERGAEMPWPTANLVRVQVLNPRPRSRFQTLCRSLAT